MTPQEILAKCAEIGVKLQVRDGKLAPAGSLPVSFIKLSQQFIPYKKELIEYIQTNMPELVVQTTNPEQKIAYNVAGTPNDKVMRLRVPCVNLGNQLEKAAGSRVKTCLPQPHRHSSCRGGQQGVDNSNCGSY